MEKWVGLGARADLMRLWGQRALVYNELSGKTHDLNGIAAEALLQILEQPSSSAEIATRLAESLEIEPEASWRASIDSFIRDLADLGLIAPAE